MDEDERPPQRDDEEKAVKMTDRLIWWIVCISGVIPSFVLFAWLSHPLSAAMGIPHVAITFDQVAAVTAALSVVIVVLNIMLRRV